MSTLAFVFVASIFASAGLLFLIQPLVARMLLPLFGGTPAVWNTALVFYQCALLLGYAYAHASLRRLGLRRQMGLHAVVLLVPLISLPPVSPDVSREAVTMRPAATVLGTLAVMIGLPFLALAANSSLVQRWFAEAGAGGSREPYRLYAASNLGSLLGLLAYPFVVEPLFGLARQAVLWSVGYAAFVVLTFAAMAAAARSAGRGRRTSRPTGSGEVEIATAVDERGPPSWGRRADWMSRAAIASSLLMSTTMQITTDVAPIPLLWIVPLVIYLTTFIAAFARPGALPRRPAAAATVLCLALALGLLLLPLPLPFLGFNLLVPLATLAAGALVCHADIAADRPDPAHLTEYYLLISLGGALGGVMNSLVAPVVFDGVAEYPLTLAALAAVAVLPPGRRIAADRATLARPAAWLPPLAMLAGLAWAARYAGAGSPPALRQLAWTLPYFILLVGGTALILGYRRGVALGRAVFAAAFGLTAAFAAGGFIQPAPVIDQARSFFGVTRITELGGRRSMIHGTTLHGLQWLDAARRRLPSGYYHPDGPLGRLVGAAPDGAAIGIIGLGTGALAAQCDPGQRVVFFEIDPLVESMARRYFTFLEDARCDVDVVLGDGRLSLEERPDGGLDLLVVDAFSSDAVPVHLLTAESLALYRRKLAPGGAVVYHISNRYLDLEPIVAGVARSAGLEALGIRWVPDAAARTDGAATTSAVVVAEDAAAVARAGPDGWREPPYAARAWTDDHVSVLPALGWSSGR